MVKDSVKFLVDTMLKNDEEHRNTENEERSSYRLQSRKKSADNNETNRDQNRSNLCLC